MRSSAGSSLKLRRSPNASSCRAVKGSPNSSQTTASHLKKSPSSMQKITWSSTSPRSPGSAGFLCSKKSSVGTSGPKVHLPSRHADFAGLCFFFLAISHSHAHPGGLSFHQIARLLDFPQIHYKEEAQSGKEGRSFENTSNQGQ